MKLLLLLGLFTALLGCGDDKTTTTTPTPPKTGPLVTFEKGGGIASQPITLTVSRSGQARLDVRTGPKVTHSSFTVSPDDLQAVDAALDDARGVKLTAPTGGCADCFTYAVRADGISFTVDEAALSDGDVPKELAALVGQLTTLSG
jgi:hypothetical protein